ncbi:putative calpain-like cysteine peptidase [Trypanosoma cruzi]|uniref:Putative calpain-like cysteine peptidase n=1 Tax=Trypanosoma cruzi TaxID=5693 RepID=A0A2V2X834_TRYCR|nr:putative calpain-like cysteine peptidase [Trypanosoma cruzi]
MDEGKWGFYNDTKEYEFHVFYTFYEGSSVEPIGGTTVTRNEDGTIIAEIIAYPLETLIFIEGEIDGAKGRIEAYPVSERYKREAIKRKVLRSM